MHIRQVASHVETDQEYSCEDSQRDSFVDQTVLGYPVDDENGSKGSGQSGSEGVEGSRTLVLTAGTRTTAEVLCLA